MLLKRWILIIVSLIFGFVVTYVIIYVRVPLTPPGLGLPPVTLGFGSDVAKFAYSNVALLFISAACIMGIWLDYFLDTKFLKS